MVRKPWPVTVTIHGSNNIQTWFRRGSDMLHDSAITIWSRQSSDTVQTMFRDGHIQTVRPYITMLRYGSYRAQTWFRRWRIQFGHCSGRVSAIMLLPGNHPAISRPPPGHHPDAQGPVMPCAWKSGDARCSVGHGALADLDDYKKLLASTSSGHVVINDTRFQSLKKDFWPKVVKPDTVYSSDIPGGAGRRDAHRLPLLPASCLFGGPYMVHIRTWFGHAADMVQTWFRYGSDMVQIWFRHWQI